MDELKAFAKKFEYKTLYLTFDEWCDFLVEKLADLRDIYPAAYAVMANDEVGDGEFFEAIKKGVGV